MPKLDVTIPAFKVTNEMKDALDKEIELDPREQPNMIRLLLAEALVSRQSKRSINKLLV